MYRKLMTSNLTAQVRACSFTSYQEGVLFTHTQGLDNFFSILFGIQRDATPAPQQYSWAFVAAPRPTEEINHSHGFDADAARQHQHPQQQGG